MYCLEFGFFNFLFVTTISSRIRSAPSLASCAIAGSGDLGELHHELKELEDAMSDPDRADEMEKILARFGAGDIVGEMSILGLYRRSASIKISFA